jgi:hypothetical protein
VAIVFQNDSYVLKRSQFAVILLMWLVYFFQNDSYDKPRAEKYSDNEKPVQAKTTEDLPASKSPKSFRSETPESRLFLFQILDLVDRYWNGSKSLHKNNKFKGTLCGGGLGK